MLQAQDLMTPRPTTVSLDAPLVSVLDLIVSQRIHQVPVCDEDGQLVGMISDRELSSALPDRTQSRDDFEAALREGMARDIMTHEPVTVLPDCPLPMAIALMLSCRVLALPVVEHGFVVGILTQTDILRRYAQDLSAQAVGELGPPPPPVDKRPRRIHALCPDHGARSLVTSPLAEAGFEVQSFDTLPDLLSVWHLVLPDLLIVDRSYESNPNLSLVLRSEVPALWLENTLDGVSLHGEGMGVLELPTANIVITQLVKHLIERPRTGENDARRPRVLVAEDDHVVRRILCHHLSRSGYELVEAEDGAEAEQRLKSDDFDIILLDVNMPGISGLKLLRELKDHPHPPKRVIISANQQDENVMEAFALGADDFVKKPFNPDMLIRRLDRMLQRV